jgi:hypothetical protein
LEDAHRRRLVFSSNLLNAQTHENRLGQATSQSTRGLGESK